jgi:Tol biopolymer transport system component
VGAQNDVAVYDRVHRSFTRLTFSPDEDAYPIWTPDGSRVVYASSRSGALNIYLRAADGNGGEARLTTSVNAQAPCDWSPDGRTLYYAEDDPETRGDLWAVDVPAGRPRALLRSPANEREARISPDGHWVAYESDESGRPEVYVASLGDVQQRWQVSPRGGTRARWSATPGELLFQDRERGVVAVRVTTRDGFRIADTRRLFRLADDRLELAFAPSADVFLARMPDPGLRQLVVASRWGVGAGRPPRR